MSSDQTDAAVAIAAAAVSKLALSSDIATNLNFNEAVGDEPPSPTSSIASSSASITSSAATSASAAASLPLGTVDLFVRPSSTRGRANSSWLRSGLTFSFGPYSDGAYDGLHSLRVLNEDVIAAGGGFDTHGHAEFEIFSYIISGRLKHADSLGHTEVLGRGAVQFTSAGTGLSHSEVNACSSAKDASASASETSEPGGGMVHLLQVWVTPNTPGLKPAYATKKWSDKDKTGRLRLILSKDGGSGRDRCIKIHQDLNVYASILPPGSSVYPELKPGRTMYLHLAQDALSLTKDALRTGLVLTDATSKQTKIQGGDGVRIENTTKAPQRFCITGAGTEGASAEFLLFDIKQEKKGNNNKGKGKK